MLLLVMLLSCAGSPPSERAQGETFKHDDASFRITVPSGWKVQSSPTGVSLIRQVTYGGGYPTVNIRRLDLLEAEALSIQGTRLRRDGGEIEYRFQRWNNSKGRGYRLEVLQFNPGGDMLFVEGSVWDSSASLNKAIFDEEIWPIVNSLDDLLR